MAVKIDELMVRQSGSLVSLMATSEEERVDARNQCARARQNQCLSQTLRARSLVWILEARLDQKKISNTEGHRVAAREPPK